jgi:hypothetical protein
VVAGYAALGWFECRVVDVSRTGAGLVLNGPWPESDGWDLIVHLRVSGEVLGFQLRGHVRNQSHCAGCLRVAVEFADMTPAERDLLELALERLAS